MPLFRVEKTKKSVMYCVVEAPSMDAAERAADMGTIEPQDYTHCEYNYEGLEVLNEPKYPDDCVVICVDNDGELIRRLP